MGLRRTETKPVSVAIETNTIVLDVIPVNQGNLVMLGVKLTSASNRRQPNSKGSERVSLLWFYFLHAVTIKTVAVRFSALCMGNLMVTSEISKKFHLLGFCQYNKGSRNYYNFDLMQVKLFLNFSYLLLSWVTSVTIKIVGF